MAKTYQGTPLIFKKAQLYSTGNLNAGLPFFIPKNKKRKESNRILRLLIINKTRRF